MGSIGLGEILILVLIAYLLFGPEKLPKMARDARKAISEFLVIRDEVQSVVHEVRSEAEEVREALVQEGEEAAAIVRAQGALRNGAGAASNREKKTENEESVRSAGG